ncbi:hypothetical protein CANINC_000062 [Pichia inconspicua]|uniref:UspA domain-containing protein n=1 Tax=Pichia inconspicua TaxID=52247 RepID=A0A4T0X741_9ASCO|nr:hypothetical protein CANINC_000062 [[Candida] inconspicua]
MRGPELQMKHTPLVSVELAKGDIVSDKIHDVRDTDEEEELDGVDDEEEEDDDDEEVLLDVEEVSLPKDVGEINVRGHLRFDEEMPPDETTKNNTIFNALMYHMSHSYYDEADKKVSVSGKHEKKVIEFDTFSRNLDVSTFQMIRIVQDPGYEFHNMTKTWLVAYHDEKQSIEALEWTLGELADDNDIVAIVKVVSLQTIMKIGVEEHRKASDKMFDHLERIKSLKTKKKIKLVMEVRIGAVDYMVNKAIRDFDPVAMVMGTKGIKKASFTNFLVDDHSTTKQFLQHGKVPIIVINPNLERKPQEPMNTESSIRERLTLYPSVYDSITGMETLAMERSISSDSTNGGTSRTSRFLRMGKSLSRTSSPASSRSSSLNPSVSNDRELRSVKSMDSTNTLSPIRSNSSLRRALSPFRLFKK